jgi:glycosyltransferase involved in cell wall biosynthesis
MGLEGRVEIINRQVDVNAVLAGVHASVVLSAKPALVKAYPHSLMESLAAGKPVLVSRGIPLAALVEEKGCGRVVEGLTQSSVTEALSALARDYASAAAATRDLDRDQFSYQRTVRAYRELYERAGNGE